MLKKGSKGPLVKTLQELLNEKFKPNPPLVADSVFGSATEKTVIAFQKKTKITVDGIVGPETAGTLNKLPGTKNSSFAGAFGPWNQEAGKEDGNKDEPKDGIYTFPNGDVLTKKDYEDIMKRTQAALMKFAEAQEDVAQGLRAQWDELDRRKKNASFFASLLIQSVPDPGIVSAAEKAAKALKSRISSGNFDNLATLMNEAELANIRAINAMIACSQKHGGTLRNYTTAAEAVKFTSDRCFDVVKVLALIKTGGKGGPLIDGGIAGLKRLSEELAKAITGTSDGLESAVANITVDAVLAGGVSALLRTGGSTSNLIEGGAARAVKFIARGKWIQGIGGQKLQEFIVTWAAEAGKSVIKTVLEELKNAAIGDTKTDEVLDKIGQRLAKEIPLAGLNKWMDDKFAGAAVGKLKSLPIFKGADVKMLTDALDGIASSTLKPLLEKAIDETISSAKSAQEIGTQLVAIASRDQNFLKAVSAQLKKK